MRMVRRQRLLILVSPTLPAFFLQAQNYSPHFYMYRQQPQYSQKLITILLHIYPNHSLFISHLTKKKNNSPEFQDAELEKVRYA